MAHNQVTATHDTMNVLNNFLFRSFMISEGLQFFWKKLFSRILWP